MTKTQRDAIAAPEEGMVIYNTDTNSLNVYSGGQWTGLGGDALTAAYIQVDSGNNHSCAIRSGKTVDCWGSGANGRLGHNSTSSSLIPVAVRKGTGDVLTNIDKISMSGASSCALDRK